MYNFKKHVLLLKEEKIWKVVDIGQTRLTEGETVTQGGAGLAG